MAIFLLHDLGKTACFFDKGPDSGLAPWTLPHHFKTEISLLFPRCAGTDVGGQALPNARTTVEFIWGREMFWVCFFP